TGLKQIHRILRPGASAVLIVPNFYVRTEQPMEFRANFWKWQGVFFRAGVVFEKTGTDLGPPVFKKSKFKRVVARSSGKILCMIPFMQYQFVFVLRKPAA